MGTEGVGEGRRMTGGGAFSDMTAVEAREEAERRDDTSI